MIQPEDLTLDRWGLRFCTPGVEADYRRWRAIDAVPITRAGMFASMGGYAGGILGFYLGAPELFPRAATWILTIMFPWMVAVVIFSYVGRLKPHIMPMAASGNFISGFLTLALGVVLLHNFLLTSGILVLSLFTGSTIFRLAPSLTALAGAPYVLYANYLLVHAFQSGEIGQLEFVACACILVIAFLMGLAVCTAIDHLSRKTYRNERLVEHQRQALLEERANLSKFLSPEVTRLVREQGIEATLAQKTLDITVVCCDLRGFTAFTNRNGAHQMATVLREYYETVVEVAKRFGGTVKDFAGDGVLILVGAPVSRDDHPQAGLDLARDVLESVSALVARFTTSTLPLGVGVGVATGPCAVGAIGSQSRLEYTAVGTAVNLASRLCSQATHGQLVICLATADKVRQNPDWVKEQAQLKGIDEPVRFLVETLPQLCVAR